MRRSSILPILIMMTLFDSGSAQCSCYTFDGAPIKSWSEARKLCEDNNGDLVSMETVQEWEFIKTQIQNRTTAPRGKNEWWIGLEKRDGKWEWLTNHTLTYNKWQKNKPDDRNKNLIHVIIAKNYPDGHYGTFRNKRDDLERGTICEYKGKENCREDLERVKWCYTTEPPSRSTITLTSIPSQTTKIIHTITDITGNFSSDLPHHFTSSSNGPVEGSRQSFPTAIVGSVIGVLLLTICLVILACIWKRRKQERKPRRNSHLGKKSRVPVKLEHSLASNTNDLINSTDVTVARDNSLQQLPITSVNDHKTDGTSKDTPAPVYASVEMNKTWEYQRTDTNQSNMTLSHVIYAELNEPQRAVTQSSYNGNKEPDCISYENELTDDQNLNAQKGIQLEDTRLVYAQLAEFKDSEQQQSLAKMPSPYKPTEYATIMEPILSNRSKSKENISQI